MSIVKEKDRKEREHLLETKLNFLFFEIFWTVTDLAEHLRVCPNTIYDWVHQRVIPYHKLRGRLLRFKPSEIKMWLSEEGGRNGNK